VPKIKTNRDPKRMPPGEERPAMKLLAVTEHRDAASLNRFSL
jgi:hypothetical protein